jgi:Zn-dependent M28 family amino/carboxypeptidase/inosine-uridine nucleoside N-ribohydrolase
MRRLILALLAVVSLAPVAGRAQSASTLPSVDGAAMLAHIRTLSSDEFEGRLPGTAGEQKTVAYLEEQFRKLGLAPGNTDGSYVQQVPLVGITASPDSNLTVSKGDERRTFEFTKDVVPWTKHVVPEVSLQSSDMIFVGYGVQAPEYDWDDFKGVDVRGKTIVVLINDPAVPDPKDPSKLDPKMFAGKAMTYYGRWTYKYEIGAKLGAAGVIIVHETGPAGYPFSVVQNNAGEKFDLVTPDKNASRAKLESWVSLDAARQIFQMAGQDFDALKKQAVTRAFKPVPLGLQASITIKNTLHTIDSRNVVAKLEGSDPSLKDEYVIFMAHWDHLGRGTPVNGDDIDHGALDIASGTAALLEIARTLAGVKPAPKRSMLFLAVTAEEQGLLGSEYYAKTPIYPLEKTLAVINMDGMNMFGRTRDITVIGMGASDLEDVLKAEAAKQKRVLRPDPEPEKGFYYRSDHFSFAKNGVPALSADAGIDYIGKPAGYGTRVRDRYTNEDYHRPSDEVKPDWVTAGAVDDANLFMRVGYDVAQGTRWPQWRPGNEFRAIREERLKEAGALGTGAAALSPGAADRPKVILDTDIGDDIDDAWALGFAMLSPDIDLVGVTVNFRNTPLRAKVACKLLHVGGRGDVPVAVGRKTSDDRAFQYAWAEDFADKQPIAQPAADFIVETARKNPGQITLVAVGPLQNVADALEKEPNLPTLLKRVVLMSGSIGPNAWSSAAMPEWNVVSATTAAQAVYAAGFPITIVPLDSTTYVRLKDEERERLVERNTPVTRALEALYRLWIENPEARMTLHDQLAVAETVRPGAFFNRVDRLSIAVDDKGYTRVDPARGKATGVCLEPKRDAFMDFYIEGLLREVRRTAVAQ